MTLFLLAYALVAAIECYRTTNYMMHSADDRTMSPPQFISTVMVMSVFWPLYHVARVAVVVYEFRHQSAHHND
jgi:hypothetical protein